MVVLGWRLAKLCDELRNGDLLAMRVLPDRYANLDQNKTFVASIKVTRQRVKQMRSQISLNRPGRPSLWTTSENKPRQSDAAPNAIGNRYAIPKAQPVASPVIGRALADRPLTNRRCPRGNP